jgi:hypothetical protein
MIYGGRRSGKKERGMAPLARSFFSDERAALAAALFYQADLSEGHLAVDRLTHVVDREPATAAAKIASISRPSSGHGDGLDLQPDFSGFSRFPPEMFSGWHIESPEVFAAGMPATRATEKTCPSRLSPR